MTEQLAFDLPVRTARGRDDFFVSPANAQAVAAIDGVLDWPQGKLVLAGPEGAGKTHLTHVWAAQSGAVIVAARDLAEASVPELANHRAIAVEDVPEIAGTPAETALFHLHNMVVAAGGQLLMTGTDAPVTWPIALPDLRSRLLGTQLALLGPPDDALLAQVMAKLFSDRQLAPDARLVTYLLRRIDRSFASAAAMVARLDALALRDKRELTVAFAREVLDKQPPGAG